jgi:hypothetical protein
MYPDVNQQDPSGSRERAFAKAGVIPGEKTAKNYKKLLTGRCQCIKIG